MVALVITVSLAVWLVTCGLWSLMVFRWSNPAFAGGLGAGWSITPLTAVYPRVCGGIISFSRVMNAGIGLPPLVRRAVRLLADLGGAAVCSGVFVPMAGWQCEVCPLSGVVDLACHRSRAS